MPEPFRDSVTLEEHQRAIDYTRARVGDDAQPWDLCLLALWALTPALGWLAATLGEHGVLFLLAAFLVNGIVMLPHRAWRVFRVEQRFGFNRTTVRTFVLDHIRGAVLFGLIAGPLFAATLWLMRSGATDWWLWAWAVWSAATLLLTWIGPTWIAPLFNRFEPLTEGPLADRLRALLERSGFAYRGLYVMDGSRRSAHSNAYFAGIGGARRIVLFDTLLAQLSDEEIEAVLAHEIGHYRLGHIRRRLLRGALFALAGFAILGFLNTQGWFQLALGLPRATPQGCLLLALWIAPLILFPLSPFFAWSSRRDEYAADAFAAAKTGPAPMIRALQRIYSANAASLTSDPVYSAFHDSHPTPRLRIARLQAML
mgnify:CR=1 FL=1